MALSADFILGIPDDKPEMLFSAPDKITDEHRALVKKWHPDHNKDSGDSDVIARINLLVAKARAKVKAGKWDKPGEISIRGTDNILRKMRFRREAAFEIGHSYYGRSALTYLVRKPDADLARNAIQKFGAFTYPDAKIRGEIEKYLPKVVSKFTSAEDGSEIIVLLKSKDVFSLDDVLTFFGGKIEPRHVAWIMNSLYNTLCYFEISGIAHNGIGSDTVFISPQYHTSMIYGGWWYSSYFGEKLVALPPLSHKFAPPQDIRSKISGPRIDLTLARVLGRKLLGDITGVSLHKSGVPAPMVQFLRNPAGNSARADYAAWGKALADSFGKRRFVKMEITESDIYEKGK